MQGLERETEDNRNKGFILSECGKGQPRVVLTKGIAGIGKTVSVQKFILDWAEGKANEDIDLLLVLPFRELNSTKDEEQSLHELLLTFFSELKEFEDTKYYNDCKILFIFDGLDESQLPLAFRQRRVSDISKAASLDELITNLIDGNLLPSALVWITSRPAAIDKIPPDLIHRMTEVRGFTDLQKEEYFKKRISDQSLASRIISHVRKSRTLEIMCHIPVFCWITATVLEQMLKRGHEKIPSSLTELYTRFLLIQTSKKKEKYLGERESDPLKLSDEDVQLILKLGKLAFDNLQKSNIEFSEYDMNEYDIDVTEASMRSGVFTEIIKEEDPIFSVKQYSFVHLSFQEYLAAFFVIHTNAVTGLNAMQSSHNKNSTKQSFRENDEDSGYPPKVPQQETALHNFQKCAIDEALKSDSGHLDLFLRFLLGLSLHSSQKLLKSFSMCVHNGKNIQQTIWYLKSKLREEGDRRTLSSERCINLIHCLQELDDHSMTEEIQRFSPINRQAENKQLAANVLVDELEKTDHDEHLRPEVKHIRLDHGGHSQEKSCASK
ncbi:protein NLRC3-like isoform X2 [Colossoma macropomum]|uniref:protein NLRC3-like isoform X2 n=1 Tax=Colossoma macropomum TaxID=42526 RepID=UPI0018646603|nr:protein NLRC3-like isoform X2 [Colossoma macropomum]